MYIIETNVENCLIVDSQNRLLFILFKYIVYVYTEIKLDLNTTITLYMSSVMWFILAGLIRGLLDWNGVYFVLFGPYIQVKSHTNVTLVLSSVPGLVTWQYIWEFIQVKSHTNDIHMWDLRSSLLLLENWLYTRECTQAQTHTNLTFVEMFTACSSLATHMRIYTHEKTYKCGICMKQLTTSSSLTWELIQGKNHTNVTFCMKQFTTSGSLAKHMGMRENTYQCEICGRNCHNLQHWIDI